MEPRAIRPYPGTCTPPNEGAPEDLPDLPSAAHGRRQDLLAEMRRRPGEWRAVGEGQWSLHPFRIVEGLEVNLYCLGEFVAKFKSRREARAWLDG